MWGEKIRMTKNTKAISELQIRELYEKETGLPFNYEYNEHGAKRPRASYILWLENRILKKHQDKFIKELLFKLALVMGLNDKELWWLIDRGEKIDNGEYERLMKQGREV